MSYGSPPSSQKPGIRPIAFVLQTHKGFGAPVILRIRPEDLTRNESSRGTVTQTLGRKVSGWLDEFGEGLPSVTISGHTGWRSAAGSGADGAENFKILNETVQHDYHKAKQDAIDQGIDPATVKLIFVDMLDGFTWNVNPSQFILRRSRSRPLLFQYNISLQAIDTEVDNPLISKPVAGGLFAGIAALESIVSKIEGFAKTINSWIAKAVAFKDKLLAPIGATIAYFTNLSARVFAAVNSVITNASNAITGTANDLIGFATDIAKIGTNINRTVSAIANLPGTIKATISQVAAAYSEAYCIFKNSLKPKKNYNNYDDLFGASNCSSTTGGRASSGINSNVFDIIQPQRSPVMLTSGAQTSMAALANIDPILAPMEFGEMDRHLKNVNGGFQLAA